MHSEHAELATGSAERTSLERGLDQFPRVKKERFHSLRGLWVVPLRLPRIRRRECGSPEPT